MLTNKNKRQRLIAMRECLRETQQLINKSGDYPRFLCHVIPLTNCPVQAKEDAKNLVMRAIDPYFTFRGWLEANNRRKRFSDIRLMKIKREWIDQLCNDINREVIKMTKSMHPTIK